MNSRWADRRWSFTAPPSAFPAVVERLRGTCSRAADLVRHVAESVLGRRPPGGAWSAKEHIGHLDDLATLDEQRLHEYLRGAEVLSAADPDNAATEAANHNSRPVDEIIAMFRERRSRLTRALSALDLEQVTLTCEHPRLRQPMRLIDWAQFVADHDDHHLAKARGLIALDDGDLDRDSSPGADVALDLNQVTMAVTSIEVSAAFYELLGLTRVVDVPHYVRFECFRGGPSLSIHRVDAPVASDTVVYFEVPDVDRVVDRLRRAGVSIEDAKSRSWLWREARLRDPDRNPLCIYHAGRNRLYPPWRIPPIPAAPA